MFGLLGVLLLVSRPASMREWAWIAACAFAIFLWLQVPATLPQRIIQTSAVAYIGAFLALTFARVRSLLLRSIGAIVAGTLIVCVWMTLYHLTFAQWRGDIVSEVWAGFRTLSPAWNLPATPVPLPDDQSVFTAGSDQNFGQLLASSLTRFVDIYPAIIAILALIGTWFASRWYERIARRPITPPMRPFAEFRFNDQVIWLLIVLIASAMFVRGPGLEIVIDNALLLVASLYMARGAAVASITLRRMPPLLVGLMALMILLVGYLVPLSAALIGVADTWLDFRRRMAPPQGVPK